LHNNNGNNNYCDNVNNNSGSNSNQNSNNGTRANTSNNSNSIGRQQPSSVYNLQMQWIPSPLIALILSRHLPSTSNFRLISLCLIIDSALVGVNNQCKACISPFLSDFVEPPVPVSTKPVGFGSKETTRLQFGTLKWNWEDDQGCKHDHIIPNSYYTPTAKLRLISPQHWIHTMPQEGLCNTPTKHATLQ
jgi:hypothetical protein